MSLEHSSYAELQGRGVGKDLLSKMYAKMVLMRYFDLKVEALFFSRRIKSDTHLYVGQEAVGVGVMLALASTDSVVSNFRGHGHAIARGVPVGSLMAELYGKSTGTCKGVGGSMHCPKYPELNLTFASAVVGSGIPIAAGLALANKLQHKRDVAAVFFGDGAVNSGAFHEGVNLAAIWRAPLILVCENNQFAMSTPFESVTSGHGIARKAEAYGIPGVEVDGNDVIAVYLAAAKCVGGAREGAGPSLLECKTFRMKPHSTRSPDTKSPVAGVEEWRLKDPIPRLERFLLEAEVCGPDDLERIKGDASRAVDESVEFAETSSALPLAALEEFV